ncbi:MAG: hypothetical protein GXP31_18740 [Kiritimatiellaeota bacterium]|nr:hypothetical protein [Kiritimatiellota bacterium]
MSSTGIRQARGAWERKASAVGFAMGRRPAARMPACVAGRGKKNSASRFARRAGALRDEGGGTRTLPGSHPSHARFEFYRSYAPFFGRPAG